MSDENNKRAFIKNILVVEDDYFSSVIYNSMLNGLGFNMIGPAHTAEEALEIIDQQSFDVAILDVNLEGQMVTPVVEKLESINCPFIFSTAYFNLEMLPEKYHDFPFIEKPVKEEVLIKALDSIGIYAK